MRSGVGILAVVTAAVVVVVGILVISLGLVGLPIPESNGGSRVPAQVPYSATRIVVGLGTACGFLGLAGWLIRTTDWSRPEGDPFDDVGGGE